MNGIAVPLTREMVEDSHTGNSLKEFLDYQFEVMQAHWTGSPMPVAPPGYLQREALYDFTRTVRASNPVVRLRGRVNRVRMAIAHAVWPDDEDWCDCCY